MLLWELLKEVEVEPLFLWQEEEGDLSYVEAVVEVVLPWMEVVVEVVLKQSK